MMRRGVQCLAASKAHSTEDRETYARNAVEVIVGLNTAGYFKNAMNRQSFSEAGEFESIRKRPEIAALLSEPNP